MNKSKILMITLVVVLVVLGVSAVLILSGNIGLTYANAAQYTAGETTVTGTVENLDVDWISGNVRIEYHNGAGISVTETGNQTIAGDDQLRWWLDGTTLRIRYAKAGRFRLFDTLEKTLTLSLPEGTGLKAVKIHTTSGNIDVPELAANETDLSVTSGNVNAAADTRKITAKATSGNLSIRTAGKTEDVNIEITSGSISAELEDAKSAHLHSTSGDIRISGRIGDADISATSGRISVRFDAFENLKIHVTSGDVKAVLPETPGFTCEASMTSGDFNYSGFSKASKEGKTYTFGEGGNGRCSISTTSGNIRIEKAE